MKKIVSFIVLMGLILSSCALDDPISGSQATISAQETTIANLKSTTAQPTAPAKTQVPATQVPTSTQAPTETMVPTLEPIVLKTESDFRSFFVVINGWVTGGGGQWVAGAQGELAGDLDLSRIPEGMTVEVQCVQYHRLGDEIIVTKVCDDATVRFTKAIPAGTVLTVWVEWVVRGESFKEGYLNEPCLCDDGDCRDE